MWTTVVLNERDMIILAPGTLHLVDSNSQHITQVIQAPPALSAQILIEESQESEKSRGY
jgi:hypothetical protein